MFSRNGAVEFPILIRLIDITGGVTVGREAQAEEPRDKKTTLREAPGPRSCVEDANLHFDGSVLSGARMTRAGSR